MNGKDVRGGRRPATVMLSLILWASAGCSSATAPPTPATRSGAPAAEARPVTEWAAQSEAQGPAPLLTVPPAPVTPVEPSAPAAPAANSRAADAMRRLTTKGIAAAEWETAHQDLAGLGADAAAALRAGLTSADPLAREWSASILALNLEAAVLAQSELRTALADDSGFVRANAAAALALVPGQGAGVLPVLVELAQSPDAELRRMAALNLSNLGDEAASNVEALTPLLDATDPEVVRPVVELLGRLGSAAKPVLPRLQQIAFEPTESELKSAAQHAVQLIESPGRVDAPE